jgi:hypothetical protein
MNELRHIDVYPGTSMAVRVTFSRPEANLELGEAADVGDADAQRVRSSEGRRHTQGRLPALRNSKERRSPWSIM